MTQRTGFVSHAHLDNALCTVYVEALRQQGIDIWYDLNNMQNGHFLTQEVQRQLQQRSSLIIMVTPNALNSFWVELEINTFLGYMAQERSRLILPVRLASCEMPGILNAFKWIDAINQPFEKNVADIALALGVPALPERVLSPPLPSVSEIPLPTRLVRLGFNGYMMKRTEVVVPPVCDVPAGPFLMGSDKQHDPQAYDDEIPQYQINLAGFQIAAYPVTVAEYACAVRAGASKEPLVIGDLNWQAQLHHPDHPVVCITWKQAKDYVAWLTDITQQSWRLPTEAEWEKAARGIDGRIYPWGDHWDKMRANTNDSGANTTTSVGAYVDMLDASPYGVHDIAGNVREWTSSIYQMQLPYRSEQAERDGDGTSPRVLRGGSWDLNPKRARVASRSNRGPDKYYGHDFGFRLARDLG